MQYNDFLRNKLHEALCKKLPGWEAHFQLAPKERLEELKKKSSKTPRQSAVLLLLFFENGQLKLLFILRSIYDGAHSGQISFPGGQKDENEKNLLETALRETYEEIGVKLDVEHLLGKLTNIYIPPSNFIVEPFVAFVEELPALTKDNSEVQEIYKIALKDLMQSETMQMKEVLSRNNQSISAPCFYINNLNIWGATAMILNELLFVIKTNNIDIMAQKKDAANN